MGRITDAAVQLRNGFVPQGLCRLLVHREAVVVCDLRHTVAACEMQRYETRCARASWQEVLRPDVLDCDEDVLSKALQPRLRGAKACHQVGSAQGAVPHDSSLAAAIEAQMLSGDEHHLARVVGLHHLAFE